MAVKFDRKLFPQAWLTVWAWIFVTIVIVGIAAPQSFTLTCIKLGGILLCFIYALQTFPHDRLLQAALGITFVADVLLSVNNSSRIGLLVFLGVQLVHAWRLSPPAFHSTIIGFALLSTTVILLNAFIKLAPSIYVICTCYVIALVTNVFLCWQWQCQQPNNPRAWLSTIGFLLFICCDICTGTSYLSLVGAFPSFLYAPANFFAWFFYYPSQVLISNSSKLVSSTPESRSHRLEA